VSVCVCVCVCACVSSSRRQSICACLRCITSYECERRSVRPPRAQSCYMLEPNIDEPAPFRSPITARAHPHPHLLCRYSCSHVIRAICRTHSPQPSPHHQPTPTEPTCKHPLHPSSCFCLPTLGCRSAHLPHFHGSSGRRKICYRHVRADRVGRHDSACRVHAQRCSPTPRLSIFGTATHTPCRVLASSVHRIRA
jgi:hypothetical protein